MEDYRQRLGQQVRLLREERGWSSEELAHRAGLAYKTVSRIENGKHDMRSETRKKLAKALSVEEDDLRVAPPSPLGLSAESNQLDRIEAMVREIYDYLELGATQQEEGGHRQPPRPGKPPSRQRKPPDN